MRLERSSVRGRARSALAAVALPSVALLSFATACGRSERAAARDSSAAATSAVASASTTTAGVRPPCERTGHWIPCQVRERLHRAGLVLRDTTIDDLPKTGVAPSVFRLGRGGIAIYLFADSASRRRAAAMLDTVKFVPASQPLTMLTEATLIENDNLLALLFSRNDQQRERVSDALLAGPPQP